MCYLLPSRSGVYGLIWGLFCWCLRPLLWLKNGAQKDTCYFIGEPQKPWHLKLSERSLTQRPRILQFHLDVMS